LREGGEGEGEEEEEDNNEQLPEDVTVGTFKEVICDVATLVAG
jgi:hypothetical protein